MDKINGLDGFCPLGKITYLQSTISQGVVTSYLPRLYLCPLFSIHSLFFCFVLLGT